MEKNQIIDVKDLELDTKELAKEAVKFFVKNIVRGIDIDGKPLPIPKAGNKPLIRSGLLLRSFGWRSVNPYVAEVFNSAPYAGKVAKIRNYFGVSSRLINFLN